MRTSKYLGKTFGNWTCVHVGIASVQGARAKWRGHMSYYYDFTRRTSDNKANKNIRLNSTEASKVYKGIYCVEEILNRRVAKPHNSFTRSPNYIFD